MFSPTVGLDPHAPKYYVQTFLSLVSRSYFYTNANITSSLIQYFWACSIIVSQRIACITILHTALHQKAMHMYMCVCVQHYDVKIYGGICIKKHKTYITTNVHVHIKAIMWPKFEKNQSPIKSEMTSQQ